MSKFSATEHLPECPLPVVHLNGTGRETLVSEYLKASKALNAFCAAFAAVTCNGRDYYPISDDAYSEARKTRLAVFVLCDEIDAYLNDHLAHLSNV
jgi:hypothetical protein